MARILLTGGAGFVGMNIAEALLHRGDDVVLFSDRGPEPKTGSYLHSLAGGVELVDGDIRNAASVAEAARGCDILIHGAAVTPGAHCGADAAVRAVEVNITGTINALVAADRAGIDKFVYLGSAAVYGGSSIASTPLGEDTTPPSPEGVYAVSKFAAERIGRRLASDSRLDFRVVRIGSAFGPWERDTGVRDTLSAIFQVTMAAMRGDARVVLPRPGRRDWIYSRDVANAILRIVDAGGPPSGVVNIGLGYEWTVSDWCRRLEMVFPATRCRIAKQGEAATIDYHGALDRPRLEVSRLSEEIGFQPEYDLDRAFADYMNWLRERDPSRSRM